MKAPQTIPAVNRTKPIEKRPYEDVTIKEFSTPSLTKILVTPAEANHKTAQKTINRITDTAMPPPLKELITFINGLYPKEPAWDMA